jgi:hypothetical protein
MVESIAFSWRVLDPIARFSRRLTDGNGRSKALATPLQAHFHIPKFTRIGDDNRTMLRVRHLRGDAAKIEHEEKTASGKALREWGTLLAASIAAIAGIAQMFLHSK